MIEKPIITNKLCIDKRYNIISHIIGQDDNNVYVTLWYNETNPEGMKLCKDGTISWETFNNHFEVIKPKKIKKYINWELYKNLNK